LQFLLQRRPAVPTRRAPSGLLDLACGLAALNLPMQVIELLSGGS
jgi:hypothetical protein